MRVVYQKGLYRIIEVIDTETSIEDLKGDMFCPKAHPDIDPEKLAAEEREFERLCELRGIYRYELQKWNPEIGKGWKCRDACKGFIGEYNTKTGSNEFIDDMKFLIADNEADDLIARLNRMIEQGTIVLKNETFKITNIHEDGYIETDYFNC